MNGALTRYVDDEPRRFAKPTRSSAPLTANPHGTPRPVACEFCSRRTATYDGRLPKRWRLNRHGLICCEDC